MRLLAGTHRAHRREVAVEIRLAGDELHPSRRQAADEVQLQHHPIGEGHLELGQVAAASLGAANFQKSAVQSPYVLAGFLS